jgi:2-methylisocitrate lyase-like PEP mutase family enzyme
MLPLSVDLENGYGMATPDVAQAGTRVAEAGAVGCSIEDYDPSRGIYDRDHGTERVAAAVDAAHALPYPFLLTARAENHIRGNPDLDDTIARLQAYERAGADVLYAPRARDGGGDPRRVRCRLAACEHAGATRSVASELVDAGSRRISVGGDRHSDGGHFSPLAVAALPLDEWLTT